MSPQTVRDLCDQRKIVSIRPSGNPRGRRQIVAESLDKYLQSLVDAQQPKPGYVPQVVQWDDSERELAKLIQIGKGKRHG